MTRHLLSFCLAVTTTFTAQAGEKFFLGLTAGGNYSGTTEMKTLKSGFNGGLSAVHVLGTHWQLEYSLLYSREDAAIKTNAEFATEFYGKPVTRRSYLRLPVQVSYVFGKRTQPLRPRLFAGPSLGGLVGNSDNIRSKEPNICIVDYPGHPVAVSEIGVRAGVGVQWRISRHFMTMLDAAWTEGLTKATAYPNSGIRNRNLQANASILFSF